MIKRFVFAVSLAIAAIAGLPAAASALPISRNTETVPGVQGAQTEIPVTCPKGFNFVSGGWSASDEAGADGVGIVEALWDGKRTWTITVMRTTNSITSRDVTALARCGERAPKLRIKKAKKTASSAAPDGSMRVRASCPKGQSATAGGFAQPSLGADFQGGGVIIENQRIGTRAWSVKATAFQSAGTLRSQAYCVEDRGTRFTSRTEFLPGSVGSSTTSTARRCGGEARAGGWTIQFENSGSFDPLVHRFAPLDKGWSTAVTDLQGAEDGSLTSFGYCP